MASNSLLPSAATTAAKGVYKRVLSMDTETAWAIIVVLCVGSFLISMAYFAWSSNRWNGYPGQADKRWNLLALTDGEKAAQALASRPASSLSQMFGHSRTVLGSNRGDRTASALKAEQRSFNFGVSAGSMLTHISSSPIKSPPGFQRESKQS